MKNIIQPEIIIPWGYSIWNWIRIPASQLPDWIYARYDFSWNANDTSWNWLNWTVVNATLAPDRKSVSNSAYLFSSTPWSYISLPTSWFNVTTWVTYAFSFKFTTFTIGQVIFKKYLVASDVNSKIEIVTRWWPQRIIMNLWIAQIATFGITPTSWNDFAFTYDQSTNNVKSYLNGVLNNNQTISLTLTTNTDLPVIGADSTLSSGFAQWTMDYFYVYNRALSLAEIQQIRNFHI